MGGQNLKIMIFASIIFTVTFLLLVLPATDLAIGANNRQEYFNLSLVISNSPPSISGVQATSATPNEGTTVNAFVLFNVTDANTYTDVDPTQSSANVTRSGVVRSSSGCVDYATWTGGNIRGVNCTIALEYNLVAGEYNISVQAQDSTPSYTNDTNTTQFTYGTLWAFELTLASVTFTGASGDNNVNASNDPQVLNNTGNGAFTSINVTGYNLTNGVDDIRPGNFTINATADSAQGVSVVGNVVLPAASLARNTTQDFYVWVDIPSGLSNGTYVTNATTQWLVEAYN